MINQWYKWPFLSGENTPTKDSEAYWQSFSSLLSGQIEGCQTRVVWSFAVLGLNMILTLYSFKIRGKPNYE